MPERNWFWPALAWVAALTAIRIAALALSPTDLFVDESQYWLWGQHLDFGYYSKPPLIAWVIRLSTVIGGDAPFWVRLPAPLFHAATALILGALAARLAGRRAAFWVALGYATLPLVSVGSFLVSTDTIMAPFFAMALVFWLRALETRATALALAAGVAIGIAAMAKYAALYFLIGAALAAVSPAMRPRPAQALAGLAGFGAMILPNLLWNLRHGFSTVEHTMDNAGWVRGLSGLHLDRMVEFVLGQFAVFGPVLLVALVWQLLWPLMAEQRRLRPFSWPPLALVTVQALLSKAYANWAVAGYFAGTVIAVTALMSRAPRLLHLSMAVNGTLALALPALIALAPEARLGRAKPVLDRYLGRADLSRQIIGAAEAQGAAAVYSPSRDILADLFFTGAGTGLSFYAPRPGGRPGSYYEQTFPLPERLDAPVLAVLSAAPVCQGKSLTPALQLGTGSGAYSRRTLAAYLVSPECRDALR